jgi:bifunctional non-homologous end joining protein LigD
VWTFAKEFSHAVASQAKELLTAVYQVSKRPKGRVLVDYNQNAWGRTLASVYSVRPREVPSVSTPVRWEELERGITMDDFRIDNVPARVRKLGDLWKPVVTNRGRFRLEVYL